MELVGIAHRIADVVYGQFREFQQFGCLGHAVADKEFLRTLTHRVAEDFAEVAAVQIAEAAMSSTDMSFWKFCSIKEVASRI